MYKMNMRLLNDNEITKIYENYMPCDFAKDEIKPLSRILELCKLDKYFCYGFYEKGESETETMIAYVFLVTSENRKAVALYERLGFLKIREISRWFRVFP